ncbi:TPA: S8 family peptidase [Clostridium perfringens]
MEFKSSTPKEIFNNANYVSYLVQYQGDIIGEFSDVKGVFPTLINNRYAIITVDRNLQEYENDISMIIYKKEDGRYVRVETVTYIKSPEAYVLQQISPLEAANVDYVQVETYFNLTGKGVIIGILDTGIDYLNEELMDSNGNTRILGIWDQTISSNNSKGQNLPYGTFYTEEEINRAIKLSREGGDPYTIVPSKDEIGHGTSMAGIIGGKGKNPNLRGVAPDCKFLVVKLAQAAYYKKEYNIDIPVYNITEIFTAIQYLYSYFLKAPQSMIIYMPLGTNRGSHKGASVLEEFLESILISRGIAVVTGAGNEGAALLHGSGIIKAGRQATTHEFNIDKNQKKINIEIWIETPIIASLEIISPTGGTTGEIQPFFGKGINYSFIIEQTTVLISYYIPEELYEDALILIILDNVQPGTWIFKFRGLKEIEGKYNIWLPARGISKPDTRMIPSDPYGTITTPGTSYSVITVAAYNQVNNTLLNYSGRAFEDNYIDVIDVAAGGTNALTIAPNNETTFANGTSVAAAIVAGICLLLFQWGIVEGNYPYMFSQTLKSFIARGTRKRKGETYPNPQLGYGIVDAFNIFNLTN